MTTFTIPGVSNNVANPQIEAVVDTVNKAVLSLTGVQLSDYELSFIREGIKFSRTSVFNNYAAVVDAMELLTKLESEFNYLIYTLQTYYDKINYEFRSKYDVTFAGLSRGGSPNQAATESTALSRNNNELLNLKKTLTDLEQLLIFLKQEVLIMRSKLKTLDAKRSNTF